jgi:hypothetical protein
VSIQQAVAKVGARNLPLMPQEFVIPSEARDLHFAANCRSLASLGMTINNKLTLVNAPDQTSTEGC